MGEPTIKRTAAQTFIERWMCATNDCSGEMHQFGGVRLSSPPLYDHQCDKCGRVEAMRSTSYPRTVTEEVR